MKILFLGEYSNVYTELSKELKKQGHEVLTISDGDSFKNFPSDIRFFNKHLITNNPLLARVRNIAFRLGLQGMFSFWKQWKDIRKYCSDFDVVQLINPVFFSGFGSIPNIIAFKYLKKHNKKIFLSILGDDYYTVEWFRKNDHKSNYYHISTWKSLLNPNWAFKYKYCLFYKSLNDLVVKNSNYLIPGLNCYYQPYLWSHKVSSVVPFPIDRSKIGSPVKVRENEPIRIFHGWQKGREARKGNDIFDRVLKKIEIKYGDRVAYKIVQNVPFTEYVKSYSESHIFIDQLLFFDKGYNGLLGMAAGKVVFSGFSQEALNSYPFYQGQRVGIDASMDEDILFNQFSELIDNPTLIEEISRNAISFVVKNHEISVVAKMYMSIWEKK